MTLRRIKRTRDFELSLLLSNEEFIATPRDAQRTWLLNRWLKEAADELEHLHVVSKSFVPGIDTSENLQDRSQKVLSDAAIMEDWQIPVMETMANMVAEHHGDALEIGFGRGVAADFLQARGLASHTVIECNPSILARCEEWRERHTDRDIRIVPGKWQDVIEELGEFDGILFHTYPLDQTEFIEHVVRSSTFAEHFFGVASQHLRAGGVFSYLTNEIDSLSRAHQRSLLEHFSSFTISLMRDLAVPEDTSDALWADSMIIVRAEK